MTAESMPHRVAGALPIQTDLLLPLLLKHAPVIVYAVDCDGRLILAQGQGLERLGLVGEILIGAPICDLVPDLPAVAGYIQRALGGDTFTAIVEGVTHTFECHFAPLRDDAGRSAGVVGIAIDITERLHAERARDAAHRRCMLAREQERLTLARELHDGPIQQVLAIHHQLAAVQPATRACGEHLRSTELPILPALAAVRAELLMVAQHLRAVTSTLRPPGLLEFGVSATLDDWLDQQRRHFPAVSLVARLEPAGVLPELVALSLLRMAQEAVRNALRHAQPQGIEVQLTFHADAAVLQVTDDGCGFVVPHLADLEGLGQFGLIGLIERAALVEGEIAICSEPGYGTAITIKVPLQPREEPNV